MFCCLNKNKQFVNFVQPAPDFETQSHQTIILAKTEYLNILTKDMYVHKKMSLTYPLQL